MAAVAVLALYSREPPSTLAPGDVVAVGGNGLAVCSFLPAVLRNGCEPLRAAVTESGSLVVFKGGKTVPVIPAPQPKKKKGDSEGAGAAGEGGEVVWSSPAPKKASFAVSG